MTNFEIYTYLKAKKGGGEPAPVPPANPALRLMDWEGTVLKEYTAEQVASLTALPTPSSLNTNVDRELLSFQGYNWALSDIKSWVTVHEGQCLTVGAIYTTTDGQDHNFWDYPRFDTANMASTQKRSTTSIGNAAFQNCYALKNINIPDGVTTIGNSAFYNSRVLADVVIQGKPSLSNVNAFGGTYDGLRIYVPREYLSWYSTATNWDVFYDDEVIVAIEDYIEYLESIGIDVSDYEEEQT